MVPPPIASISQPGTTGKMPSIVSSHVASDSKLFLHADNGEYNGHEEDKSPTIDKERTLTRNKADLDQQSLAVISVVAGSVATAQAATASAASLATVQSNQKSTLNLDKFIS